MALLAAATITNAMESWWVVPAPMAATSSLVSPRKGMPVLSIATKSSTAP